jgi:hypothetical protein
MVIRGEARSLDFPTGVTLSLIFSFSVMLNMYNNYGKIGKQRCLDVSI